MNITMILEMAASADDRAVVTAGGRSRSAAEVLDLARRAATDFDGYPAVLYTGVNDLAYPVALFGAAMAGVPFVPLNYRLGESQLAALRERHPGARVLGQEPVGPWLDSLAGKDPMEDADRPAAHYDGDAVAVIIYTSGTTAAPKAAILRHRHLLAYVLNTIEFSSAAAEDATVVAVPPYHIAGLTNLLSNLYSGRRVVYLDAFEPRQWIETVRREKVTHAMVVPTMLARIVEATTDADVGQPFVKSLAYGGARTPRPVIERALQLFPDTNFVNAYGLTETASSIAVLGPEDHREAIASDDPTVRDRLGSVGRPLPGIEILIRDEEGVATPDGETGLVFVRGEQISGEYGGRSVLDADGWFATRDLGRLDAAGFLYIEGRSDDTIIRGGENIAPAEIEDVLHAHPTISEAAVIGVPDPEWGQRIVAVVVGSGDVDEIKQYVRDRLRSSKTPDAVVFHSDLPRTETGKLLRRNLVSELEKNPA
ncbi:acyl-CoA synthetase (AMP-forming)/AMP-acid ligase II [Williamsia limnetica]|uniref:Acyl-CoA synthetase (AMP-forming)/AMP-acid ligase II n=1 Tax=Williamsia limnetica TaxID=882452 RepID=A0A318S071_WILLI|nr:class I adenylate-forming enzyme family protein [Williamsia limnetica]PYE16384.1 acyl-CoA synthetase (AMP-forming)/AMP-acid ligase II [Williamsia limnetica]